MTKGSDTSFFNLVLSSPFYVWCFCLLKYIFTYPIILFLHTFADCKIFTICIYSTRCVCVGGGGDCGGKKKSNCFLMK